MHAPTMMGCGERRHELRAGIDTSTFVEEVSEMLFFNDLKDIVLVGTSSGGMIACGVAERMRHRIAKLVLVDALALGGLIGLGIAVYGAGLWLLRIEGREELAALLRSLRAKLG